MSLLKQNITRKKQEGEITIELKLNHNNGNSGKNKVKVIWNSMVYAKNQKKITY